MSMAIPLVCLTLLRMDIYMIKYVLMSMRLKTN